MGFCTPDQHAQFLKDAPRFEHMLTDSGIVLIKLWLDISKEEQARRLGERIGDPLKRFKVSSLDAEAQVRWDAYTEARDAMLARSHTEAAPWTIVATDKKKQARLNVMRHLVRQIGAPKLSVKVKAPDPALCFDFEPAALTDGRLNR